VKPVNPLSSTLSKTQRLSVKYESIDDKPVPPSPVESSSAVVVSSSQDVKVEESDRNYKGIIAAFVIIFLFFCICGSIVSGGVGFLLFKMIGKSGAANGGNLPGKTFKGKSKDKDFSNFGKQSAKKEKESAPPAKQFDPKKDEFNSIDSKKKKEHKDEFDVNEKSNQPIQIP